VTTITATKTCRAYTGVDGWREWSLYRQME